MGWNASWYKRALMPVLHPPQGCSLLQRLRAGAGASMQWQGHVHPSICFCREAQGCASTTMLLTCRQQLLHLKKV